MSFLANDGVAYHPGSIGSARGVSYSRFKSRHSLVGVTMLGISGAGLYSHFGSATGLASFKVLALVMLALAGLGTMRMLWRYRSAVHGQRAMMPLLLLSIIPFIRITMEVSTGKSRQIVDGLLLIGPYYLLPFTALGIVAYLAYAEEPFDAVLRRTILGISAVISPLVLGGHLTLDPAEPTGIYAVSNNLIIPAALLLFFHNKRRNIWFGRFAVSLLLIFAVMQASRSYLLVSVYLGLFTVVFGPYHRMVKLVWATLICFLVPIFAPTALQFFFSDGSGTMFVEKIKLDSLLLVMSEIWRSGNVMALFFWEGNSRSTIIIDAFSDFTTWDYLVGRGVNAQYTSFIVRSTIEIGWLQELFRLGLLTVMPTFAYALFALFRIAWLRGWQSSFFESAMIGIGLTRILDGFIFGMPNLSLYTLFFWMFIMQFALKKRYQAVLFGQLRIVERRR